MPSGNLATGYGGARRDRCWGNTGRRDAQRHQVRGGGDGVATSSIWPQQDRHGLHAPGERHRFASVREYGVSTSTPGTATQLTFTVQPSNTVAGRRTPGGPGHRARSRGNPDLVSVLLILVLNMFVGFPRCVLRHPLSLAHWQNIRHRFCVDSSWRLCFLDCLQPSHYWVGFGVLTATGSVFNLFTTVRELALAR